MKNKYFISVVGKSNVGKSTLINYLCNSYVSSESNKPQTTRMNLYAETSINHLELVFIDTPGLPVKDTDLLSAAMKNSYMKSLDKIDLLIILTDTSKIKKIEAHILDIAKTSQTKTLIVVNKIDLFKDKLTSYDESKEHIIKLFKEKVFFISLYNHQGLNSFIRNGILNKLKSLDAKNNNKLDQTKNDLISIQELIRGVIINNTHNELPYDTAVKINKSEKFKQLYKIDANIYVEKLNQRKIIIGSKGNMIKLIGSKSRHLLELKYKKNFYLKLNVCVKKNWKNNYVFLKELGYIS